MNESEQKKLREENYNSHVIMKELVHDNLAIMQIKINQELNEFVPGQYLSIGSFDFDLPLHDKVEVKGKLIRRAYSVSSPMLTKNEELSDNISDNIVELYVAKVEDGVFSPSLFDLKENDLFYTSPKFIGHYNLPEGIKEENLIFISTGTGLAPHLTMINHLLKNNYSGKILLIECVRFLKDLAYFEKLTKLVTQFPNFYYKALTTRDSSPKLYIQDYFRQNRIEKDFNIEINQRNTHAFLCGNPNMIGIPKKNRETGEYEFPIENGMCEILMKDYGLIPHRPKTGGNIHFEKYW